MMQKLLRGARRDKNDLANAALANDFSALFSAKSLDLLSGTVAASTAVREQVFMTIDDIMERIKELQHAGHRNGLAGSNISVLHWFKELARAA